MYDRAPRILTRPAANSFPSVGPGTYYNPSLNNRAITESYAPFQSMSVRDSFLTVTEGVAAAPGPGHYSPLVYLDNVKGGSTLKSNRFHPVTSFTPGPGTYVISSQWTKKNRNVQKDAGKVNHVKFRRQGNAPSIPSSGFNNGYEEDANGLLKPQDTFQSDSTLGPAYYNVSHTETTAVKKYRGIHFGKLRSNRSIFGPCDGPGPSDYSPIVAGKGCPPHSSNFIPTNIPRYHELVTKEEQLKGVPGPGQYGLKSQFAQQKCSTTEPCDTEAEKAPFGSYLQRFTDEKQASPACTTYRDPRTSLDIVNRLHGMKKTPFSQSSKRFKANQDAVDLPGPGTYNDNYITGMASQLMRKVMFDGCPFGSTSARTVPLTKKDELLMPGPADYENEAKSQKFTDRPSHSFASTTKRLHSSPVLDGPFPGSYEVSQAYDNTQGKIDTSAVRTGFLSTLERFVPPRDIPTEEIDPCNPGPGEYESLAKNKHLGGVINSEKPRFKTIKNTNPGPGKYELSKSQRDTVLQGTYNITLSNPLAEETRHMNNSPNKNKRSVVIGI